MTIVVPAWFCWTLVAVFVVPIALVLLGSMLNVVAREVATSASAAKNTPRPWHGKPMRGAR